MSDRWESVQVPGVPWCHGRPRIPSAEGFLPLVASAFRRACPDDPRRQGPGELHLKPFSRGGADRYAQRSSPGSLHCGRARRNLVVRKEQRPFSRSSASLRLRVAFFFPHPPGKRRGAKARRRGEDWGARRVMARVPGQPPVSGRPWRAWGNPCKIGTQRFGGSLTQTLPPCPLCLCGVSPLSRHRQGGSVKRAGASRRQ